MNTSFDILGMILLIFYFWLTARFASASLGQRIMKYKIIPIESGEPEYLYRVLYSIALLIFWPIAIILEWDVENGIYWWDRKSNTRAISTRHKL